MKSFVFRYYVIIAIGVFALGIAGAVNLDAPDRLPILGALTASVLSFCYFVQQQRLAETHLFKELFTEFNKRYDGLNEDLAAIAAGQAPSRDAATVITDYLNLCAEEFLFYQQGYILPEVWRSWCRGMQQYLDHQPFSSAWEREAKTGSYYGLTNSVISRGAT